MISNVTLTINGREFSSRLSTYSVSKEINYANIVTTMDGKEHAGRRSELYVINFSLMPLPDATIKLDYSALSSHTFNVTFTNPYNGGNTSTYTMRVDSSSFESAFGINSIDGQRYYKVGSTITLRETAV